MKRNLHISSQDLETEYLFRRLERLKKADSARFYSIINSDADHISPATDFSSTIKFGWEPEKTGIDLLYDAISRTVIYALSSNQFELHFKGDEEPQQKIICLASPIIFIDILVHLQVRDYISRVNDLTPLIVNRCLNKKSQPLNQRTVETYIAKCKGQHPAPLTEKILSRLNRLNSSTIE